MRQTFVGGVPVILNRVSFSGELGYEIYCAPHFQLRLAEAIEEAGADLDLKWYGARALMSLRLEKGWGAWGLDFRPDFTAAESGLDAFIKWDKEFIGKDAALKQREEGPSRKLVTLTIDSPDTDVSNDEAILLGDKAVGYISSGGFAHHVGKSMALGYVPTSLSTAGTQLEVEILGNRFPAEVLGEAIYDPSGEKMRA